MNLGGVFAGLAVGVVVGLTGSGGSALLTPLLIVALGVNAKSAVASDLVASVFMRPVAGLIHLRRSVVRWPIVGWLMVGSMPTAFAASVISGELIPAKRADALLEPAIGGLLLLTGSAAVARRMLRSRRPEATASGEGVRPRCLLTVAIGMAGGVAVGVTSVGSGTLILVGLALVYPTLSAYELVGTDLVQAVPLVLVAAAGHLITGGLHVSLTAAVIAGGVPGAAFGASVARFVPASKLSAVVAGVIFASGCALIGWLPGSIVGGCAVVTCVVAIVVGARRQKTPLSTLAPRRSGAALAAKGASAPD
jgi:uncharacterized protein